MCKVDKRFKSKLYKNTDPIKAIEVYNGIIKSYNLIHTTGNIAVFRHKRRNTDSIVWNVIKPYESGHSHFKNVQVGVIIAENISKERKPKADMCIRNLASYLRIANEDYKYYNWVSELIETKIDKKINNNNNYHNVGKTG